jgi:plastocyanin
MRRLMLVVGAVPALALALASAGAPAGVSGVTITTQGFDPRTLTVHAGDTVTWTNSSAVTRQVVSDTEAFQPSPILQTGQSWSFTFPSQGRFAYHDGLHDTMKGAIQVAAAGPSVSIAAGRPSMVFADRGVTLSGRVSVPRVKESVQVFGRVCGRLGTAEVATVATTRGGLWRLAVRPDRTTTYGARWGTVPSPSLKVQVLPRMKLARSGNLLALRVTAGVRLARRVAVLQRFDETGQTWVLVRAARLKDGGLTAAGSFLSKAAFRSPGPVGRLRAFMSASQAGPCYGAGSSNALG